MNQYRLFQALILVGWCTQLLMNVLPFAAWYRDPVFERILAVDGYGSTVPLTGDMQWLSTLPLLGFFIASVGMFFFQNWGRYLYLVLWIFGWILTLLFGVRVVLPAQGFMSMALGTIDGALLALAFISPLRASFVQAERDHPDDNGRRGKPGADPN